MSIDWNAQAQLELVSQALELLKERIRDLESDVDVLKNEKIELQSEIETLRNDLDRHERHYEHNLSRYY